MHVSSLRRRRSPQPQVNQDRWLLTYADMITLLVAFFIMLYAMSIVNKAKFQQIALSVRSGFAGDSAVRSRAERLSNMAAPTAPESNMLVPLEGRGGKMSRFGLYTPHAWGSAFGVNPVFGSNPLGLPYHARSHSERSNGSIRVHEEKRGLVLSIATDKILFKSGTAELRPESLWILDDVARACRSIPNDITIEGYTDDLPITTARYPSNWELSTARATSVLRYLSERAQISPARLCASGYGSTRPLVPNNSETNRALNRRVNVVILRSASAQSESTVAAGSG